METKKEQARPIIEQATEYVDTRLKLLKLEVIERSTSIIANVVVELIVVVTLVLTFLFASFTLALFLGDVFHSNWKGFGLVALLYLLIAVILMVAKKPIERPIVNILVRKLFK
ncbi:phage holin family protein [Mucilaginibacter sp. ZT4R22]|uniref:Phage holin family protein n=1 Tax=Mucilaginibacter pankratovii TaxID=2772110 RepID=A0ABR7WQY9_9SPHI|nr:phage holin family protein [Mucilaginibacter pankratovii]MBD1364736.1 phage holin family protein [Mucilaginibacter pankratovii]